MGNGAKAAQKRERNAKDAKAGAKSQLKINEAAKSISCGVCKQTFLKEHAENKHSKTYEDCFPGHT